METEKMCQQFMPMTLRAALLGLGLATCSASVAQTIEGVQDAQATTQDDYRNIINRNTITVMGASLTGSYIKIVDDIAKAVDNKHELRVLPVVGEGGSQNIRDILYLKGVDAGIVKWGSIPRYADKPLFENLKYRLQYIARLFDEEIHIVGNHKINTIRDLEGKRVGFHGGAFVLGQDLLLRLNIKPAEVKQIHFFKGLELIKSDEIDAMVRGTASPMKQLNEKFDPEYHKLVQIPLDEVLIETHVPTELSHEDYPDIIPEGKSVETVATAVVLTSYAWPRGTDRYRRVEKFTKAFFSNIDKILNNKNRHPKWDNINLAAELPGWTRFPAAAEWLAEHKNELRRKTRPVAGSSSQLRSELASYIQAETGAPVEEEKMDRIFKKFEDWRRSKSHQTAR